MRRRKLRRPLFSAMPVFLLGHNSARFFEILKKDENLVSLYPSRSCYELRCASILKMNQNAHVIT